MFELVNFVLLLCLARVSTGGLLQFTQHPDNVEAHTSEAVVLQCAVNGDVTHWLFNNEMLQDSGDITTNGGTLTINSYQPEQHAGQYRCAAETSETNTAYAQVSHFAEVSHMSLREFERHPEDFTVYLLDDGSRELAAFECNFAVRDYGSIPIITWEHRDSSTGPITPLLLGDNTTMVTFQYDHTGYFQLQNPTSADDGSQVRCVATDPDSTDQVVRSNWATVTISDEPPPNELSTFSLRPPMFVHFIEDQNLVLGCSHTVVPSTEIRWYRDNDVFFFFATQFLFPGFPGVSVYGRNNIQLNEGTFNHVGSVYECEIALGDFSIASVRTTVVDPPPPYSPPQIVDTYGEVVVPYGANVPVTVANYTGQVQWWFNGVAITANSSRYQIPNTGRLILLNVDFDHAGVYQAEALDITPSPFSILLINVAADECSLSLDNCDVSAICMDTAESFTCDCFGGFSGNGTHCQDIDECVLDMDICDPNAQCTNTMGSFECSCNVGFSGDGPGPGVTCNDIDECVLDFDNCDPNAQCTSTMGSFECSCNVGFSGDGVTCGSAPVPPTITNAYLKNNHIFVNWTIPSDNVISYTLEIYKDRVSDPDDDDDDDTESFVPFRVLTIPGNMNVYIFEDADLTEDYSFRVSAVNMFGRGDFSEFHYYNGVSEPRSQVQLQDWEIALIVIFVILACLLCFLFICCLCICWRRERRTYYASEIEKKDRASFEEYRMASADETKQAS